VARPVLALIVAVAGVPLAHVTRLVISAVEPSEKVPVAVNCCVLPSAIGGLTGDMVMESRTGAVIVSVAIVLVIPLLVAVILTTPVPTPVARPVAGSIVAFDVRQSGWQS